MRLAGCPCVWKEVTAGYAPQSLEMRLAVAQEFASAESCPSPCPLMRAAHRGDGQRRPRSHNDRGEATARAQWVFKPSASTVGAQSAIAEVDGSGDEGVGVEGWGGEMIE